LKAGVTAKPKKAAAIRFGWFVSNLVVRRPRLLGALLALLVVCCAVVSVWRLRLDSEVLNLLPDRFSSVNGLIAYNKTFAQARELTFVLWREDGDADLLETHQQEFADALAAQDWVTRIFYRSPLETQSGLETFDRVLGPLLYQLESAEFSEALESLKPEPLAARLENLKEGIAGGSPKAEVQAAFDPFGLAARALAPMQGGVPIERGQPLASADGKTRLVLAVTTNKDLDALTCKRIMEQVNAFITAQRDGWGDSASEVGVTGRTPFVAEISESMRSDVQITLASSAILVAILFFVAFGRLSPLAGIGSVLLIACAVALAFGGLLFGALNILTVGFCAILIGLGVDFGVLLYARYQQCLEEGDDRANAIANCIQELSPSILYGALTTGLAFLTLILSESPGFTQLGVLIAVGVVVCAFLMLVVMFLFVRKPSTPRWGDPLYRASLALLNRWQMGPRLPAIVGLLVFGAFLALAISPVPKLPFDADPRSLEPTVSNAGAALRQIEKGMGRVGEPFIVMMHSDNASDFRADWVQMHTHLTRLKDEGRILNFYSPAPMVIDPAQFAKNSTIARAFFEANPDFTNQLESIVRDAGFDAEALAGGFAQVSRVAELAKDGTLPDWHATLPGESPWLFLVERYFALEPNLAVGFVTPKDKVDSPQEAAAVRAMIEEAGVPVVLTGWTFTLMDLIPWTQRELVLLTSLVLGCIALLLAISYREWKCWAIHLTALIFAFSGMVASLKLLNQPVTLLNVLAFPLVLGVGVDYGLHTLLSIRGAGGDMRHVAVVLKSVLLGSLTTVAGFGSLAWSNNPSLTSLGIVCAVGVLWCIAVTACFVLPMYLWTHPASRETPSDEEPVVLPRHS